MSLEGGGGNGREMGESGEGILLRLLGRGGSPLGLLLEELLLLEEELLVLELLLLLLRLLLGLLQSRALRERVELLPRDLARVEEVREHREGLLLWRWGELILLSAVLRHSSLLVGVRHRRSCARESAPAFVRACGVGRRQTRSSDFRFRIFQTRARLSDPPSRYRLSLHSPRRVRLSRKQVCS